MRITKAFARSISGFRTYPEYTVYFKTRRGKTRKPQRVSKNNCIKLLKYFGFGQNPVR
jgi:hypothetical protein